MSRARDLADRVLHNRTHEDIEGGRESIVTFKGEQSGGEISTLAQIQASHDGTSDDQKGDLIFKTNDGSDNDAPTEAARIDSSRNVLVGKTAVGSTAGIEFRGSIGYSSFTRDGNFPVTARRLTDDGDIIQFEKDTTVVGSIGTRAGRIKIGDGDVGLFFDNSNNRINPEGPSDTSANDNAIDLGGATQRFKNLYLSGGAYIGGTTSGNYLDDYEEGEYTPLLYGYTTGSGTLLPLRSTHNVLSYTKVGRKVTVNGKIETSGSHSATGSLLLSVPFTSANLTDQAGQGAGACFFYRTGQLHENPTVVFGEGVDYVYFFSNTSSGDVLGITANVMDTAIELIVGFTYFTT